MLTRSDSCPSRKDRRRRNQNEQVVLREEDLCVVVEGPRGVGAPPVDAEALTEVDEEALTGADEVVEEAHPMVDLGFRAGVGGEVPDHHGEEAGLRMAVDVEMSVEYQNTQMHCVDHSGTYLRKCMLSALP